MNTDTYCLNKKKTIGLLGACVVLIILFFVLGWIIGGISERSKMEKAQEAAAESEAAQEPDKTQEAQEPAQEKTTSMNPASDFGPIQRAGATPGSNFDGPDIWPRFSGMKRMHGRPYGAPC